MSSVTILDGMNVFLAGLLAGALFVIDYGVQAALAGLEEKEQVQLRQALIRRLRVLVPSIFVPTVLSGLAVTILGGSNPAWGIRFAALAVLLTSFLLSLVGTAPINKTALSWQPGAPPRNWRALIRKWERLDRTRTWAALIAFALFLAALTLS